MSETRLPVRRPCIFVSAVSRELEQARAIAGHSLRVFRNVDVVFQQELGTETGDLLEMLKRHIDECDGVVQLIGDAYGAAPPDEVEGLGEISYTQFEFLYALQRRKKTWLIRVDGTASRNPYAIELVGPGKYGTLPSDLLACYEARLRDTRPGAVPSIQPDDPPALRPVLEEHARRRKLQRQYSARLSAHLEYLVKNDDALVQTVRDLRGIDSPPHERGRLVGVDLRLDGSFVGRAALTADILTALNPFDPSQPSSRRIVLHGLGGSGKTALATEIGHLQNDLGRDVLMLRVLAGHELDDSLERLSEDRALAAAGGARVVRQWLREHSGWLMIIDGVDDRDSAERVHRFCAEFQSGHFLITSCFRGYWRSAGPAQQFRCYDVDMLEAEASHRLLRVLLDPDRTDAEHDTRRLSGLLGGLPLAIRHASGFLNSNIGDSVTDYIAALESAHTLPDAGEDFAAPPRAVAATWQANLRRVLPGARTLLRLLSFLTDHPLPTSLLQSADVERAFKTACLADPLEAGTMSPPTLRAAARELSAYSLLTLGPSQFAVHRLVLRMTQRSLRDAAVDMLSAGLEFQQALARAVPPRESGAPRVFLKHVIRLLTDYIEAAGRVGWTPLYPHLQRLVSLYLEEQRSTGTPLALAADELLVVAEALSLGGHFSESLDHCVRAASSDQTTPLLAARAHTQLAWEYFGMDRLSQALEHYATAEQALQGAPVDTGYEEAQYDLYSGRGWIFRYLGQVEEGLADYRRAFALASKRGHAHEQADASIGLGGVYAYSGDTQSARAAYEDAVRFADRSKNPWLQALATYFFGYFLINHQSRVEGIEQVRQAMAIGERFGFSDIVEECGWILAIGLALQGDSTAALRMAERALENPSPVLEGWDHLIRGIMRFRLGDSPGARADFEASLAKVEKSLSGFECFDHLDTAAFAHAGMTLAGHEDHRVSAIAAYRRARTIAPASGIRDIGMVVFSCFGSDPAVIRLRDQLPATEAPVQGSSALGP